MRGVLQNGTQIAVGAAAVLLIDGEGENYERKTLILQNVGSNPVRVGAAGVTATTGVRLAAGDTLIFEMPFCPVNDIWAIRDGASDSTVLVQEVL